jgi:uncharacterized protein (TIGR03435 family)
MQNRANRFAKCSVYVSMRNAFLVLLAVFLVPADLRAQPDLHFEVASIKRNLSGDAFMAIHPPGGDTFTATNVSLGALIVIAYDVRVFQVAGTPSWGRSERYDVTAKAEGPLNSARLRPMLQSMLAERFQLTLRTEEKELQGYALGSAKNGPKLKPSMQPECGPPGRSESSPCGGFNVSANRIEGREVSIHGFIENLANQRDIGRPILDRTGLPGLFDISLEWTPANSEDTADVGASIFTAIEEQLGLRLEPHQVPTRILVIDHAERPSEIERAPN